MSESVWINGQVQPLADAKIGVEDRGYQFADGVYEVIRIYDGRPFTLAEHLERLERSCDGIRLPNAVDRDELAAAITDFIAAHGPRDGMVYLQVTRGVAPRNHVYPAHSVPVVLFYTRPLPAIPAPGAGEGAKLQTVTDERWRKCWIKSIALLANILAKNEAIDAGCDEAVFVEDGIVSECSASNLFAVIRGQLVTHPVGPKVLPGITRLVLQQLCAQVGVAFVERPVTLDELRAADELFITSTTRELSWVSHLDGKHVANGRCGPVTRKLHEAYVQRVRRDTASPAKPARKLAAV